MDGFPPASSTPQAPRGARQLEATMAPSLPAGDGGGRSPPATQLSGNSLASVAELQDCAGAADGAVADEVRPQDLCLGRPAILSQSC